jgi:hypothetical protein
MIHPVGNFLFQKMVDRCCDDQIKLILNRITQNHIINNSNSSSNSDGKNPVNDDENENEIIDNNDSDEQLVFNDEDLDKWMDDTFKEHLLTLNGIRAVSIVFLLSLDFFGTRSIQRIIKSLFDY